MGNVYTNFEDSGGAGRCKGSYVFVYSPKLDTVGRVNAGQPDESAAQAGADGSHLHHKLPGGALS